MVLRVRGTWFREYGYIVSHYPPARSTGYSRSCVLSVDRISAFRTKFCVYTCSVNVMFEIVFGKRVSLLTLNSGCYSNTRPSRFLAGAL